MISTIIRFADIIPEVEDDIDDEHENYTSINIEPDIEDNINSPELVNNHGMYIEVCLFFQQSMDNI